MDTPTPADPRRTDGTPDDRARPLTHDGLAWAVGICLFYLQTTLAPLVAAIGAAVFLALATWRWPVLRPVALAALGFLYAYLHTCPVLCQPLPPNNGRTDLVIEGVIVSVPTDRDLARRFLFRVDDAPETLDRLEFTGLVRLSWYRNAPPLRAGDRWRLQARLTPPHGYANPGGFDYERWLFSQRIKATGYVRDGATNERLGPAGARFAMTRFRQALRDHLERQLPDTATRALVQALVIGERGGLTNDQWEVLTLTGTNHLIAISGLHVGLVAGFVFVVGRGLWSRSSYLVQRLAAPRAAAGFALLAGIGYSALAGFAVSTQRALIMLAVVLGALVLGRTLRPFSGLTLALVGVLLLDPGAVLSFGFWLSFVAVAILLFALGQRHGVRGLWQRWGQAQWAVALGLLPLLLLFFGRASLIAPAVNLVAVPIFTALLPVILLASLLSLIPPLAWPLTWVAELLGWCFAWLEHAAEHRWAATAAGHRPTWVWLAAGAGVGLLLAPRGLPGRALGVIWLLPLLLVRPPAPAPGSVWLTLLDVGQGLAIVVRTHQHTLVYDVGPGFPSGFNTGSAVVRPYLRHAEVQQIDGLIISHGDNDHAGGLPGLIGALPIGWVKSGEPHRLPDLTAELCQAGMTWNWDGVQFAILHPEGPEYRANDASCVLRIEAGASSMLLTGDIERRAEQRLVAYHGEALRSTVLIAGHHGSDTSSTAPFLDAVAPRYVLYATGFANRYGFPATAVRERVAAIGAAELDTSRSGAIHFRMGANGEVEGPWLYRSDSARLWTHRPGASQ
ncbi:DNA internalization-related competence protein ComEC/Rec2 [Thioalkalicoccus limnaeus]|uniref:DNA internalization-related competence protein ComEC/Rec2 n=1 Tax=Thioalkalicoccus limnaeus TaxID=120681 RepID=A0ABV4BBF8_9GAMM